MKLSLNLCLWRRQKRKNSTFWRRSCSPSNFTSIFLLFLLLSTVLVEVEGSLMQNLLNRCYKLLGYETCEHPAVQNPGAAVKRLRKSLKKELFGQHLAHDITLTAVKAHLDDPSPSKALVLSLHGWAGAGKTFTSQKLMNALYAQGLNSTFIRFFQSSYHFPDPNVTLEYQNLIRRNVEQVVKYCARGLFIFDEVDKTPPGVLDVLVPYIHSPGQMLDGRDYKRSIFVFLSNTGANDITRITHNAWKEGRRREELTFKDFEQVLSNEAFNTKSGLYRSRVIDKVLVDYFVPFLPLERQHVISCIKVAARAYGMAASMIDEQAEKIADLLTYWPADLKLYSTTGCKKVDTFVKYRVSELELLRRSTGKRTEPGGVYEEEDEDDDDEEEEEETKAEL